MEWRFEAAGKLLEGGGHKHGRLLMLERALAIYKVKELVLDDRSAQPPAVLRALKGCGKSRWRGQRRSQRAVTEKAESLAVNGVGPRTCGHIHRAGCGQLRREI